MLEVYHCTGAFVWAFFVSPVEIALAIYNSTTNNPNALSILGIDQMWWVKILKFLTP
ncbi:hypothetical protein ES703_104493 [subsurface metagenome]